MPLALVTAGLIALAGADVAAKEPIKPKVSRYQMVAPLPTLQPVMLEVEASGQGLAQQRARARGLQARILWIDGTANLDRVSDASKIRALVKKIRDVGFNTVVFDVKPIVGYTLYPSKLTDKLVTWKGQYLPPEFDPLKVMVEECQANGLSLFVSINVFSEGHRMAKQAESDPASPFGKPGPGYDWPQHQSVLYESRIVIRAPFSYANFTLNSEQDVSPAEDSITVFTRLEKISSPPKDAIGVVVDENGVVLTIRDSSNWKIPAIPPNGSFLVGLGSGAEFLQRESRIGQRFSFISQPEFVKTSERPEQQIPLMMNPHDPEVRARALSFVSEIVGRYAVDGILFDDRLRYAGMNADFSELTRKQFEELVGEKINWPADVFEFVPMPSGQKGIKPGKWFDAWMTWRAETMRNWISSAREVVRRTRPGTLLGVYVGSWYGEYPKFGSNYASPDFRAGFPFLTDNYRKTGFADELDLLISGCYYQRATVAEAMAKSLPAGRTVEAAGQLANRAVRDQAWAYAGIMLQDFFNNKKGVENAIQAAMGTTQGVMVFDLSHRIDEFWEIFRTAFKQPARPPHKDPALLLEVRRLRRLHDESGRPEPPVIIREGAAGTGL